MDVRTPDGRVLAVREGGVPDGIPVLVHTGTPQAGLLHEPWLHDARAKGIRLLGYDRPGYGGSTPLPGRSIADAAADAAAICEALGLERICTWGISGGGPHALACAALLPDRVAAAASLAGVAPWDADGLDWLAGMGEGNLEEFSAVRAGRDALVPLLDAEAAQMIAAGPEGMAAAMETLLSPVDREMLGRGLGAYYHEAVRTGLEQRRDGWVDDDIAFTSPWRFELDAIEVPVLVWHGHRDRFVPHTHGEWLAAHIPGVEARLTDDDGHLTLVELRVPDVHAWLLERY